jgi:pilus assembly protein CpaD
MAMFTRNTFRLASVLAVLVAGSCETSPDNQPVVFEDGAANHPITAEPVYRSLKLPATQVLSNSDTADLVAFVDDYLARGNGAISVTVPQGANSSQTITALGERLADLGVPRSRILVGARDASDGRVEIGYVSFEANTDPCGDWSTNAASTFENLPMPNFGCSVQQNIAAQVADPRDLVQSRGMAAGDAVRRMQVLHNYEQAQTTSAQKTQDQSAAVSSVGGSQ